MTNSAHSDAASPSAKKSAEISTPSRREDTREAAAASKPMKLVVIATVPETVMSFLVNQVQFLTGEGFEIHTITSPGIENFPGHNELMSVRHEVPMTRAINPFADAVALVKIWRLLRKIRPEIVQTRTPKAGLLGMIAAWLARVPVRIYTVEGLPIISQRPPVRAVLAITEWLSCRLATQVICVSRSVRRFMIANRLCPSGKARTLGGGHLSGVDVERFDPGAHGAADRSRIRNVYGIPGGALVVGYIGRLVPDKGIAELASSWETLRAEFPQAHLFLCGYFEAVHPVARRLAAKLTSDPRIHLTGRWLNDMPAVYAAIDVCVLPTYREGLSTVALETGAMGVPIVATRVPGCVDAIRNGITGLLVEPRDVDALTSAVRRLLQSQELRATLGRAAREFVSRRFSEPTTSRLVLNEYLRLIETPQDRHSTQRQRPSPGVPAHAEMLRRDA